MQSFVYRYFIFRSMYVCCFVLFFLVYWANSITNKAIKSYHKKLQCVAGKYLLNTYISVRICSKEKKENEPESQPFILLVNLKISSPFQITKHGSVQLCVGGPQDFRFRSSFTDTYRQTRTLSFIFFFFVNWLYTNWHWQRAVWHWKEQKQKAT